MFGCIVAGRLVQTNMQTISPNKFLFVLDQPTSINHIVLFLTGESMLNEGVGASIYYNTDVGLLQGLTWKFLGVLTSEKPSAVFKLGGMMELSSSETMKDTSKIVKALELGISLEPIALIEQLLMEQSSAKALVPISPVPTIPKPIAIAQRIGENMFNYIMSFARPALDFSQTEPTILVVPMKTVQDWFNSLVRRATTDPEGFLRIISRSEYN